MATLFGAARSALSFGVGGDVAIFCKVLIWSCIVAGAACGGAYAFGRVDLASILGAVFAILMGLVFVYGCYYSAKTYGHALIIGKGFFTRRSNPLLYWTTLAIPTLFGVAIFLVGIYWFIQDLRALLAEQSVAL